MMHFWDKSTTFKVYFSKKLVKKTKNWTNFQIKRYSISSRLLTDFPPSPSFLQPPKLLIQCVFIYAALFEVFIILQKMMNLLLKMIFKSSIISTFVSTGQLIFFFVVSRIWFILASECALRFEPATSKNISDLILNSYRSLHSCLCFEYIGLGRKW